MHDCCLRGAAAMECVSDRVSETTLARMLFKNALKHARHRRNASRTPVRALRASTTVWWATHGARRVRFAGRCGGKR
eukprot:2999872-Lingulodinium_polyedra.AAC.1